MIMVVRWLTQKDGMIRCALQHRYFHISLFLIAVSLKTNGLTSQNLCFGRNGRILKRIQMKLRKNVNKKIKRSVLVCLFFAALPSVFLCWFMEPKSMMKMVKKSLLTTLQAKKSLTKHRGMSLCQRGSLKRRSTFWRIALIVVSLLELRSASVRWWRKQTILIPKTVLQRLPQFSHISIILTRKQYWLHGR